MPYLCGPKNSRFTFTGTLCPHLDLALESKARSLGAAILEYERHFNVNVTPMLMAFDGNPGNCGKYFEFKDLSDNRWFVVSIRVIRNDVEIDPNQDLAFPLRDSDIVEICELFG